MRQDPPEDRSNDSRGGSAGTRGASARAGEEASGHGAATAPSDSGLQAEIALTRRELEDTVTELLNRADVKTAVRDTVRQGERRSADLLDRTRRMLTAHRASVLVGALSATVGSALMLVRAYRRSGGYRSPRRAAG